LAAGAIPPPLFFERRWQQLNAFREHICVRHLGSGSGILEDVRNKQQRRSLELKRSARAFAIESERSQPRIFEDMANTTSAKKATRKIARRTAINKSRRTQMRGAVRTVEDAIKRGDRDAALKAMANAEPELMQAAQRNIIHRNNASRKVSRLSHQIAKLAK